MKIVFTQALMFLYFVFWFSLSITIIVINSNKVVTKVAVLKCLFFSKGKVQEKHYFLQEWLQQLNKNTAEWISL